MKTLQGFTFIFFLTYDSAEAINFPSRNFIERGLKHCTGFCDGNNIRCKKGVNEQGYYDWCQKYCTHERKIRRHTFVEALKACDEGAPEKQ